MYTDAIFNSLDKYIIIFLISCVKLMPSSDFVIGGMNQAQELEVAVGFSVGITPNIIKGER